MNNIELFISLIRDSFIGSQQVYTDGSCWYFYKILKHVYPNAIPCEIGDHIVTYIDNNFYDITGKLNIHRTDVLAISDINNPSVNTKQPFNIYTNIK